MKKILNRYTKLILTGLLTLLFATLSNLDIVEGQLILNPGKSNTVEEFILPYQGNETLNVTRTTEHGYPAIDFNTGSRTGVLARASRSGYVTRSEFIGTASAPDFGYALYLLDDWGSLHIYAHLAYQSPLRVGDRVHQGTIIGEIGTTGNSSGIHLHWEAHDSSHFNRAEAYIPFFQEYPNETLVSGGNYTAQPIISTPTLAATDLAWWNTNGEVSYWKDGIPSTGGNLGLQGSEWEYLGKGTLNGSEGTSLLFRNTTNSEVHAWLDGFQSQGTFLGKQGSQWEYVGILNGSIVWRNTSNFEVGTWDTYGSSGVTGRIIGRQSTSWRVVGIGTINGSSSILWWHRTAREVTYWQGGNPQRGGLLGRQGPDWYLIDIADLDNNGNSDIIWTHPNRETHVWYDSKQQNGRLVGVRHHSETILGTAANKNGGNDIIARTTDGKVWRWDNGVQNQNTHIGVQSTTWKFLRNRSAVSSEGYYWAD